MIATGGLLRMHRRQDSLRSKNRAENKRKRKAKKKKKKTDVVVVKGKLNLLSPAGLVAAVGLIVLIVGITMAVLGYWPSSHLHGYQDYGGNGSHQAKRTSSSRNPSNWTGDGVPTGKTPVSNRSYANSSTPGPKPNCGFLCDFLDNYLYSDNLKVFGPLVMGIGIFLFICANAVLHENRDKKTKIINLRDIYSTVIDLHSIKAKEYSPLNGLVNYTQSRSADAPSGGGGGGIPGLHTRSSWPSTGHGFPSELGGEEPSRRPSSSSSAERPRSWSRDVQTFTETVYSIYKDRSQKTSKPKPWETTSIVTSSVNAFTLPVIKLNNCDVPAAAAAAVPGAQEAVVVEAPVEIGEEANANPSDQPEDVSTDTADQQGAPQAWIAVKLSPPSPVAVETGSRLSLNSLTDQASSSRRRCSLSPSAAPACRQGDRTRRFSCPRLENANSKGYIKLHDLTGESSGAQGHPSDDLEREEAMDAAPPPEGEAQEEEEELEPDAAAQLKNDFP